MDIVNLVLVHGLGGSSLDTWTEPRSKTFWPNLLHADTPFPNLCISTFGYIADWQNIFAPKNTLGIEGIARQLLDGLYIDAEDYITAGRTTEPKLGLSERSGNH